MYRPLNQVQSPTNNVNGIDQFSMNVIDNVIAELKNSSDQAGAGNIGGIGGFGMGLGMNGLGDAYNTDLGGGGGFGGVEEDEWHRMCELLKNEWKMNFQTHCR